MAAQALVAAGVGVTMLPRLALTTVHPGVVARSARPRAPVRRIWAASRPARYRSPASEAMLQILHDVAEEFDAARLLAAVSEERGSRGRPAPARGVQGLLGGAPAAGRRAVIGWRR